jgi:hypothetical protein
MNTTGMPRDGELITITVARYKFTVRLEQVQWTYIKSVDYHVTVGSRHLGMLSAPCAGWSRWMVFTAENIKIGWPQGFGSVRGALRALITYRAMTSDLSADASERVS